MPDPIIPPSLADLLSRLRGCFTAPTYRTFTALTVGLLGACSPSPAAAPSPGC